MTGQKGRGQFLRSLPYAVLIPVAIALGLAPFSPEPHAVEKLRMLFHAELRRPLDIFDLLMHAAPALLLVLKVLVQLRAKGSR